MGSTRPPKQAKASTAARLPRPKPATTLSLRTQLWPPDQREQPPANPARFSFDTKRQPQACIEGAKVLFEKAFAEIKETANLGLKARRAVAYLFVERTTANVAEGKAAA